MKKLRIGFLICCIVIIVAQMVLLFFFDLTSHERTGSILSMIGLVLIIISLVIGARNEKKQKTTDSAL
jgi:hypothetical protein